MMYANAGARKSMDSLSPASPHGHRQDFPFHSRQNSTSALSLQRRGSIASSVHSIGGALDSAFGSWGNAVLESGQNAISTLLQPPIVRTGLLPHTSAPTSSSHKPPTARDIPPVTLTNIAHVDAAEFRPYLSQVSALYEQLRRAKESEEEGADAAQRRSSKHDEQSEGQDDGHLRPGRRPSMPRRGSISSIASISSIDPPTPIRRQSSSFARRAAHGPPPLSTIPNVYFEEDFHLENPRTFDVVSERSEVISKAPATGDSSRGGGGANGTVSAPRKALATNAILQEKLSWYMDTVEMHLISSISTASTTFFTALGSLKGLHTEAAESVERIKTLRKELGNLDEEIATRGLSVVQQRRRRENLQQLHSAVLQLRDIVEGVTECESLVEDGEIDRALDSIDSIEMLISGRVEPFNGFNRPQRPQYQLRDLRGASALQGVNDDLNTLRFRIGKAYEAKLLELLLSDLRRHTETVSSQEVLMRWSSAAMRSRGGHSREPSAFPSYLTKLDELRESLLPILGGLQLARYLSAATAAFRDAAVREIRNIIRKPLPSSNDDDNESMMSSSTRGGGGKPLSQQQKSSILARNLRALEREDAEELLVRIYIAVTETLRRVTQQGKLLLDVASSVGGGDSGPDGLKSPPLRSPPFSPPNRRTSLAGLEAQEEIHKALELSNLLGQAVDIAQDKIVKLLRVRAEQSTHLPLVWFLRYFTLNLHFANECESISGRSGTTLKTVVNGQIKDFVQWHGDAEKQKLALGMESDQWAARDFGDSETELLSRILDCSTRDAPVWSEGCKIWLPAEDQEIDSSGARGDNVQDQQANGTSAAASRARIRSAVVEGEPYLLPQSAMLCLEGISHFLHLVVGIPSMTADVSTSLIAYLQLFNSRCTQLILGAGATRSAGLKNITTKHLAIASQALGFIAALVPHVREFVRRHAPSASSSSGQGGSATANAGGPSTASSLIAEFDKVRRLYQEHQNSIYDKLVEIMSGRAAMHSKTMKALDWDVDGDPRDGEGAHPYMDTLVRETTTLHRNLTKSLPEGTVRLIMVPVFSSYKDQFGKALSAAEVKTEVGRDSMMRDIEYFRVRLSRIDGFGDAADHLLGIIEAKQVAPAPPAATTSDNITNNNNDKSLEPAASTTSVEKADEEGQKTDEKEKSDVTDDVSGK